jgi:hypothetical protein
MAGEPAYVRVVWDPETGTWGGTGSDGSAARWASAAHLGGPELPFEAPVDFALPGGGRGVLVGSGGQEYVTVTREKDGRLRYACTPAAPSASANGPTDR